MIQDNEHQSSEKIIVHVDSDLEDLIPGFFENRIKNIETIHEALKEGDYETIKVIGHGMIGSGGGYGFDAITEMGRVIESAAKNENAEEIQKQAKDLSTYMEKVEIIYDSD